MRKDMVDDRPELSEHRMRQRFVPGQLVAEGRSVAECCGRGHKRGRGSTLPVDRPYAAAEGEASSTPSAHVGENTASIHTS